MKKIVWPIALPPTLKACCQCWRMIPGKPKINAPGQKMAQAQEIRMSARAGFSIMMTPRSTFFGERRERIL
jgi:hypothetical protein